MQIFKRHILSTIFLTIYFVWWLGFISWFAFGNSNSPNSCGAVNGALVVWTAIIVIVNFLTLLVKILITKGQNRADYMKFIGMVLFPVLLLMMYLLSCG